MSAVDRAFIRMKLKNAKIRVYPMKSSMRGYRICKICGQDFPDNLRGIEQYIDHYNDEHREKTKRECSHPVPGDASKIDEDDSHMYYDCPLCGVPIIRCIGESCCEVEQ